MKTIEVIQAEYKKLIEQRELITVELFRLEGEARLIATEKKPVDDVLEEKAEEVKE